MSSIKTSNKVKYLTAGVVLYMLAALSWWSLLLLRMNQELYDLRAKSIGVTVEYSKYYGKQKLMIISEGLFFGIALIIGIYLLYRSYKKEVELTRRQNNFLLSVTHELKTPLSVIKLINQTVSKHKLTNEKRTELLNDGEKEIVRLEGMVNNLLTSTKLDHSYIVNKEKINIDSYLEELVEKMKIRWPNNIRLELKSEAKALLDKELFETAILNLIDNTFQHNKDQVSVIVKSYTHESNIHIEIIDDGVGIEKREQIKIFDKFYKIGNEETRRTKGSGLGLYLTKEIMTMHKGEIKYKSNPPNGSIFSLVLNKA